MAKFKAGDHIISKEDDGIGKIKVGNIFIVTKCDEGDERFESVYFNDEDGNERFRVQKDYDLYISLPEEIENLKQLLKES